MPRILFVKTSSLGDVVHQCPAVTDAARGIPEARIDWVVEDAFAGIARMHPSVARVIPVAVRRWRRAPWRPAVWREMATFRESLKGARYDVVVDTQGLLKSALITCFASGTKHGMDRASLREPIAARFYDCTHFVSRGLHAVERNRRLTAAALGISLSPEIEYGLKKTGPLNEALPASYSVLLTMTSRADKLWPETRWIELGRALALPAVLPWGSDEERARAERIAQGIGQAVVPAKMALEALAPVLAHARNVVGLDSGLTHLAAALGVPAVAIFCGSDPALTGVYGAARAANVGAPGRPPQVFEVLQALQ
jgi:lipopolysaccharide heptosyltransferase I